MVITNNSTLFLQIPIYRIDSFTKICKRQSFKSMKNGWCCRSTRGIRSSEGSVEGKRGKPRLPNLSSIWQRNICLSCECHLAQNLQKSPSNMGGCLDSNQNNPVSPRARNNNPNQHPHVATAYPYQAPEQVSNAFSFVEDEMIHIFSSRVSHLLQTLLLNQGAAYPSSFQQETRAYPKSSELQQHQLNDTPEG